MSTHKREKSTLDTIPRKDGYYMPSEFEPQRATWLGWPSNPGTFRLGPAQLAIATVARTISQYQTVQIVAPSSTWLKATEYFKNDENIFVCEVESNDGWLRDIAPTFLIKKNKNKGMGKGQERDLRALGWKFNGWGKPKEIKHDLDALVALKISNFLSTQFYKNFMDSFIETIKLISISDAEFQKRFTSNVEVLNNLYSSGQSVQVVAGHFFNWEFANWGAAKYGKYPFIGVYMPLTNPHFNKLVLKMRERYGSIMIPATQFKTQFHKYSTQGHYAMALAADQNPGNPLSAYWISFFGKLTPFVKGPEKGAKLNNTAQVFAYFHSTKRGHYHLEYEVMTTSPNYFKDGQLTALYVRILEEKIKQNPANYLWSHKRWKYEYDPKQHAPLLVD